MMDDYHLDISHISKSGLTLFDECPAKYHWKYLSGENKDQDTKTFLVGRAFHELATQPQLFARNFVVMPDFKGYGSVAKKESWIQDNKRKSILTMDQFERVCGMVESLNNHSGAALLMEDGIAEKRFNWIDPETGVKCKIKPDFISKNNFVIDLKSADDASEKGFKKSVLKYTYYLQDPFYLDGLATNGIHPRGFLFIAVEKEPPYLVKIHRISDSYREYGRHQYKKILKRFSECQKNDEWPGYSPSINLIETPDFL